MAQVTPAVIVATAEHEGSEWHLALVRTLYANEGSCIIENTIGRGGKGEPNETRLLDYGTWRIHGADDGPKTLSVELYGRAPEGCEGWPALRSELMRKLFVQADSWGAESFEP